MRGPRYGKIINPVSTFRGEFHSAPNAIKLSRMLFVQQGLA
jgi:hypothetical protein